MKLTFCVTNVKDKQRWEGFATNYGDNGIRASLVSPCRIVVQCALSGSHVALALRLRVATAEQG
ncbi:MAG TPA: hypothetical protein DCG19_04545 [Cryomorphaceae bacterium]|nr:hypothetical protein [Owenweeksia sp.]MBG00097.1 hypothetical protein [Owenweeksia sp.]HAD96651.1 hypothetical protein [Cryomorphaceae bacterium]HBF21952.1 hypothetical protein [Cryomorphaceae bacterium]